MDGTCVRQAWLVMPGATTTPLEDGNLGYFCAQLDLGFPAVRAVVSNVPDGDGIDDRTQFFGERVVSADISAIRGAGAHIDEIASLFAPFMRPSVRPELHYVLDRPGVIDRPHEVERVITLRASGFSWPIVGNERRDIHLQWVAADPIIYGLDVATTTASTGSSVQPGRRYPLVYDRVYPLGGSFPVVGSLSTGGELGVRPRLRLFGPVNGPRVIFSILQPNRPMTVAQIGFRPTFRVDAGEFVDVDTVARTAYLNGDLGRPALRFLDWLTLEWPYIPPTPARAYVTITGQSTTEATRVDVSWRDAFLT
jgi:hypothetical protein